MNKSIQSESLHSRLRPEKSDLPRREHYLFALAGFFSFFLAFFSPTISQGLLLAPGDGFTFYYPALMKPWSLWTDLMLSGYPSFADIQFLTWYPLRLIGFNFNLFVISAYAFAAFFTYGLVYRLTRSKAASVAAGLIYGMSGFMTAHLGHTTIIHAAAHAPLILWAVDRVAERREGTWVVVGATGTVLCLLGGHPQIFVYTMVLAGSFALYHIVRLPGGIRGRAKLAGLYAGMLGLGLCLGAVQILPLMEIAPLSVRQAWSYADFISYSIPVEQGPMVIFPNLYGGIAPFWPSYFGAWNMTELSCYIGITTLLLGAIAVMVRPKYSHTTFWGCVALTAFLFCFGGATFIAEIVYHLPIIGKFRVPARAAFILSLAMAILAGIGLAYLETAKLGSKRLTMIFSGFVAALVVALIGISITYPAIQSVAMTKTGFALPGMLQNPAVYQPIILAIFGAIAVLLIAWKRSHPTVAILLVVIVIDMGSFGWYYEWRVAGTDPATLDVDAEWQAIQEDLKANGGRLLTVHGAGPKMNPGSANINIVHGIPSVTGYGPLMLSRYSAATGAGSSGTITPIPSASPLLKLLDISWVDFMKSGPDDGLLLNHGCGNVSNLGPFRLQLPSGIMANKVRLVSQMGCSVQIAQDTTVLQIKAFDDKDVSSPIVMNLLAGRDTAEWSHERLDVAQAVKHQLPAIHNSFDAGGFRGHWYEANLPVGDMNTPTAIAALELSWPTDITGSIRISELTLIDETTGSQYSVPLNSYNFADPDIWQNQATHSDGSMIVKYLHRLGRAWLVDDVRQEPADAILAAIKSGKLADGTTFAPENLALVEEQVTPPAPKSTDTDKGTVSLISSETRHLVLDVDTPSPSFVVVSQTHYPGWQAIVNDQPAKLYQTNYAFQGVEVPAGQSRVEVVFSPRSFKIGAAISIIGIILACLLIFRDGWNRRRFSDRIVVPAKFPSH
jgi:hypothetical protein